VIWLKKVLPALLVVCCAGAAVVAWSRWPTGSQSPIQAKQLGSVAADNAAPLEIRERAILNLVQTEPATGKERLREILKSANSVEIKAVTISALTEASDLQSVPQFIDLMSDPSEMIRGRANMGVKYILGRDFGFAPDGPLDARNRIIASIRQDYERMKRNPHPKYR